MRPSCPLPGLHITSRRFSEITALLNSPHRSSPPNAPSAARGLLSQEQHQPLLQRADRHIRRNIADTVNNPLKSVTPSSFLPVPGRVIRAPGTTEFCPCPQRYWPHRSQRSEEHMYTLHIFLFLKNRCPFSLLTSQTGQWPLPPASTWKVLGTELHVLLTESLTS